MHLKLIVLISVTLTLVQLSYTYRVSGPKNDHHQQQQQQHQQNDRFRILENNLNKLAENDDDFLPSFNSRVKSSKYNSLSDILNNNYDEYDEEEEEADDESDEALKIELEKIIRQQQLQQQQAPEYVSSAPSSNLIADPIVVDEEELESHSSLVGGQGHQYVSGGAGEGKQHLQPDGAIDNKEEVKSDEDLPAYCDPPNPCPLGVVADDCDSRPFEMFNAQFSKDFQEQQNCMCDDDHNECHKRSKNVNGGSLSGAPSERVSDLINNLNKKLTVVAKKSPRVRREVKSDQNETKRRLRNPYLRGEAINIHVAKKSTGF